ncbi:hypothetical protein ANN_06927 [Periplaneta americana]|uniref:Uncharacterized protein n=1 Tax=Periplaneta americana TaxID=6978 RepID=A0ABQ8TGM9_PERAM|nr:hypothetical protein ANN_06927 [Periplaneta americana]
MCSEVTATNSWIASKKGLSTTEWISILKMTANLAAVRFVPGRTLDGTRCRHGCPEIETLAHVLGFCEQELLLRNSRNHLIRFKIDAALRNKGWIVEEEIYCLAENGSTRRVDILAYTKHGIIVDLTIRFEVGCHHSAEAHHEEKSIYEPTVNYFKLKYALIHVVVFGLLIGRNLAFDTPSFIRKPGARNSIRMIDYIESFCTVTPCNLIIVLCLNWNCCFLFLYYHRTRAVSAVIGRTIPDSKCFQKRVKTAQPLAFTEEPAETGGGNREATIIELQSWKWVANGVDPEYVFPNSSHSCHYRRYRTYRHVLFRMNAVLASQLLCLLDYTPELRKCRKIEFSRLIS